MFRFNEMIECKNVRVKLFDHPGGFSPPSLGITRGWDDDVDVDREGDDFFTMFVGSDV